MVNVLAIFIFAFFIALIALYIRFSRKNNQDEKEDKSTGDIIIPPFSNEYCRRMSAAKSLAEETVRTVQLQIRSKTAKFLFCTDVASVDTVFFSCFVLRAICIMSTRNRTAAEQFSDSYISNIVKMSREAFLQEDTVQKMFDNRTKLYDQIIIRKGGMQNGFPALLQEFEFVIQTDMIEKKYVPISSNSPLPIISIFDSMQCRTEIDNFLQILLGKTKEHVDKAIDSIQ